MASSPVLRNKKTLLTIILLILFLISLVAVTVLVQQRQLIEKRAQVVPAATLSFSATSFEEPPDSPVDTSIILTPGNQAVVGVDAVINFTQGVLRLDSVELGGGTEFKTLAPITGQANCNFNLNISQANSTGILEFGVVTFDCLAALGCLPSDDPNYDPNCAKPTPNPAGQIVNPLALLHFTVIGNPGDNGTIRFQHTPGSTTDSNVVPYVPSGESVDDILLNADSIVSVTVASCIQEGKVGSSLPPGGVCCEGLTQISAASPPGCIGPISAFVCAYCPDGTCGPGENYCNCPDDCPTPTATPTYAPGTGNLTFRVKFQGINQQRPNKIVKVILEKGGNIIHTGDVGVSSDEGGVYSGKLMNLPPDTYNVFIKGWAHLQEKFENVTLAEGENDQDWSGIELLTGDADNNNRIDIEDFWYLREDYFQTGESPADFDSNEIVDIEDFWYLRENYFLNGDEIG